MEVGIQYVPSFLLAQPQWICTKGLPQKIHLYRKAASTLVLSHPW